MNDTTSPGYLSTRFDLVQDDPNPARLHAELEQNIGRWLPEDRSASVLDLGTGRGILLDWLSDRGYTSISGIDVDQECAAAAAQKHAVEWVSDPVPWLEARQGVFSAVVLRGVLPHLDPPEGVTLLEAVRKSLAPNGVVVVQVLNGALPSAGYTLANDATLRVAYTEHSLAQVLLLAGFGSVSVTAGQQPLSRTPRGWLYGLLRRVWVLGIRAGLILERGRGNNPTIFAKSLVGVARD